MTRAHYHAVGYAPHYRRRPTPTFRVGPGVYVAACALFCVAYWASLVLLAAYTGGDQIAYNNFYAAVPTESLSHIPRIQLRITGSYEIPWGYLMAAGAYFGIAKASYVSFFNALLTASIFLFLAKKRALILAPFVFTNYYFLALITSSERLKFSYLALFLALHSTHRLWRYLFLSLAPLMHLQTLIVYGSGIFAHFVSMIRLGRIRKRDAFLVVAAAILMVALLIYFQEGLLRKFTGYNTSMGGLHQGFSLIALTGIGVYLARDRVQIICWMLPAIIAATLVGGARVNMIGFTIFMFLVIEERHAKHPIVLVILAYFSYKSIAFLQNVFEYGDGFANEFSL